MEKDINEMIVEDSNGIGPDYVRVDYPSNSYKSKAQVKKKEVKKITSGAVVKKSFLKKLGESFLGESLSNVFLYLVSDVIIPSSKELVADMVDKGINMLLYGEEGRSSSPSYKSYSSASNNKVATVKNNIKNSVEDILIGSREEAQDVLDYLVELTSEFGMATVGDYYDAVGVDAPFTTYRYGWTDLSSARVIRVRSGWLIKFPHTVILDD